MLFISIFSGANVIKASANILEEAESVDREVDNTEWNKTNDRRIEQELDADILPTKPIRCAAHTVQLAVYDWLKQQLVNGELDALKLACSNMRDRILGLRNTELPMPPKPNSTRWSSTHAMLEGMLKIRADMEDLLTPTLWQLAQAMVDALEPVKVLTTKLQAVQYTCGDLAYDMIICQARLKAINTTMSLTLSSALKLRQLAITDNVQYLAALYLDPRFNNRHTPHLTEEQKLTALTYLLDLHGRIKAMKRQSPQPCPSASPSTSASNTASQDTTSRPLTDEELFLSEVIPGGVDQWEVSKLTLRHRLQELEKRPRPMLNSKVMDISRSLLGLAQQDPEIGELIFVVMALPASQVSVERAFSSLPQILRALRSRLSDLTIKHSLHVKLNIDDI